MSGWRAEESWKPLKVRSVCYDSRILQQHQIERYGVQSVDYRYAWLEPLVAYSQGSLLVTAGRSGTCSELEFYRSVALER